jgi:transcriptional regulator with XRE-family HTH domain
VTVESSDTSGSSQRNDLLRQARLRTPSPAEPDRPMSQRELAEALTAHVFHTTTRVVSLDRHYVSRIERGLRRYPTADYRAAFRAVLGVATDAELGFVSPGAFRVIPKGRRQAAVDQAEAERGYQPRGVTTSNG